MSTRVAAAGTRRGPYLGAELQLLMRDPAVDPRWAGEDWVNAVPAPWIRPIRPLATRTKGRKVPSHRAVAARYEPRWELEDG
jgi:hypothetical protein